MIRHFTASAIIIKDSRVLLVFHKKYQKWIQPGGHVDPNETPPEAACREAFEETGLHIELLSQENIWVDYPNARSIERPYACLLENIPSFKEEPPHQHIDLFYVARPVSDQEVLNLREVEKLKWFSLSELLLLKEGEDIFPEMKVFLEKILSCSCHYK